MRPSSLPYSGRWAPISGAARENGVALGVAVGQKRRRYRILTTSRRCRFLAAAAETGGFWNREAYGFLVQMARAKARSAPRVLRRALRLAWLGRWTGLLAFAIHHAFASSLHDGVPTSSACTDGWQPSLGEFLLLN